MYKLMNSTSRSVADKYKSILVGRIDCLLYKSPYNYKKERRSYFASFLRLVVWQDIPARNE